MPLPPPVPRPSNDSAATPLTWLHKLDASCPVNGETPANCLLGERTRVLLVEQDPAMRALLTESLSRHYHLDVANDGLAAWHVAQATSPALVIIDLYSPGIDSLILTRSLRAGAYMAALPIILLTESADRALLLRCLAAGASNFLLKPFGLVELLAFVQVELGLGTPRSPERADKDTILRGRCA